MYLKIAKFVIDSPILGDLTTKTFVLKGSTLWVGTKTNYSDKTHWWKYPDEYTTTSKIWNTIGCAASNLSSFDDMQAYFKK